MNHPLSVLLVGYNGANNTGAEARVVRAYQEITMPFFVQRDRYILSPYFDYLSFLINRRWWHRAADIVSIMIKHADDNHGSVVRGRVHKTLTGDDRLRLSQAVDVANEMVERLGVPRGKTFLGTINDGHPGGLRDLSVIDSKNE